MVRETTCRVGDGLISAGNEYEFRVVAINKGGESANSPTSKSVLAKNRFVKPKINKDVLAVDRTVHAGQIMKVELEVTGEPKPELVVTSLEGGEWSMITRSLFECTWIISRAPNPFFAHLWLDIFIHRHTPLP